jgi:hypothetical protein
MYRYHNAYKSILDFHKMEIYSAERRHEEIASFPLDKYLEEFCNRRIDPIKRDGFLTSMRIMSYTSPDGLVSIYGVPVYEFLETRVHKDCDVWGIFCKGGRRWEIEHTPQ